MEYQNNSTFMRNISWCPCLNTWPLATTRESADYSDAVTYSCKKFAFSSILLCKILQSKCCSVSHWVFISPTDIRSGVSNIQGPELSEAMKILYNFHPFLPMRNPSVLPSALLAWYPRTLGHPQLCARAGISLYPVSAPRLSVTRAAVSVRSPDQAVGGTTCDPSPYIVKNI